jgi:hypothetical protein
MDFRMHGATIKITLYEVRTTTKSPNEAFLRTYPRHSATRTICGLLFMDPEDVRSIKSGGHLELSKGPDGFGGLVVSMLASGSRVRGFRPGRSRWIFFHVKIPSLPSFGGGR